VVARVWGAFAARSEGFFDGAARAVLEQGNPAFALGCQGPDIFYHNLRTRPVGLEYGSLLHRRGYGTFSRALLDGVLDRGAYGGRESREMGNSRQTAPFSLFSDDLGLYALGFLTHPFLDRGAHPYIISKSGWVSPAEPETGRFARSHAFFERILDVLMLELLRGRSAAFWEQESVLGARCADPPEGLGELWEASLRTAYPERAGGDEKLPLRIANAFKDAASFYAMTDPGRTSGRNPRRDDAWSKRAKSNRSVLALVYPEKLPLDLDYLNLRRAGWRHPCVEAGTIHLSFKEIYENAVTGAAIRVEALLRSIFEKGSLPGNTAELIGNEGLSIQDSQGRTCSPERSDPLPLDAVLEGQHQRRLTS
jgi:hypothetical protein